ncbi:hypothetical protein C8Q76DRAFT_129175 [Earliella scabrosa]|nr:hypothetical protein C8Q76DRAFT_129175 [Earliella scabrosa]
MLDQPYNLLLDAVPSIALFASSHCVLSLAFSSCPGEPDEEALRPVEMEHLSYFCALLALSLSASASPLSRRVAVSACVLTPCAVHSVSKSVVRSEFEEESGPDGHLNSPWVVGVAVASALVITGVAVIIFVIKWRQRRRAQENYSQTADELAASVREQPYAWKGPYVSRTSFNRSPSPPAPAHLSEKAKLAPPQR